MYVVPLCSSSAILNISDDLDAFGNIGVYRYTEIYHFRGIPADELALRILPNLEARFLHFMHHLGSMNSLAERHKIRYQLTRDFFNKLEAEFASGSIEPGSFQQIIQILIDFSDSSATNLHEMACHKSATDAVVIKFFNNFINELGEDQVN